MRLLLLLFGLAVNLLGCASVRAFDSIAITREVFLESGRAPQVSALTQTKEGGYVIAGSDQHIPWATRTDVEGNVQWRHVLPMKAWEPGGVEARYKSATTMADDSTLLCGFKNGGDDSHPILLGMFTRISKVGVTLSHRLLYPQGDKSLHQNYLYSCVPWDGGFAVVGEASRWVGGNRELFLWLIALDANGDIKWEKLIPNASAGTPLVKPNQDLVIVGPTQITRFDTSGTIKAQRTVKDSYKDRVTLVRSTAADSVVHVFSLFNDPQSTFRTVGENLEDLVQLSGPGVDVIINRAYRLADHSLVLFGYKREGSTPTASITRISANLSDRQTFLYQPLWIAGQIEDALPTGKPGEFVTIRLIHPLPHWPDEKRLGLLLAFVRIK